MDKKQFGRLRKEFSENTSCHGLPCIYRSRNLCQRVVWILLTAAVFITLVAQLAIRFNEYLEFRTTTSTSEVYSQSLPFPAITICNFNRYFGVNSSREQEAIDALARANFGSQLSVQNYTAIEYFDTVFNGSLSEYSDAKGWQISDRTLIWCYIGDEECDSSYFSSKITNMGKCWTFQSPTPAARAGTRSGLQFAFNVQQSRSTEHITYGNWAAGLRVQIHPAYDVPEVDQLGLAIPVGQTAFVSMRKVETTLAQTPWGDCDASQEKLLYFNNYTTANCIREQFLNIIKEDCGCQLYLYQTPNDELRECTPSESVACIESIWDRNNCSTENSQNDANCECTPPCYSENYKTSISYSSVLNSVTERQLSERLGIRRDYLSENLVGINIYFDRMSITTVVESQSLTWNALLSDLGGQLGLWMGISVITLFEFLQFVLDLTVECRRQPNNKASRSRPEEGGTLHTMGNTSKNSLENETANAS